MKIGFFGGTFDPIHFGHLNLAVQMLEKHQLDEILFCPTSSSPLKQEAPKASAKERRLMVSLAISNIPHFSLLDVEIEREGHSYTIDTLRSLLARAKEAHEKKTFYLILGEDSLHTLTRWKEIEELVSLTPLLVGSRTGIFKSQFPQFLEDAIQKGITKIPLMDISSTEIRERLEQKKYCGHLIPSEVLAYIEQNQLYSN